MNPHLETLKEKNPSLDYKLEDSYYEITKAWNDDTFYFKFKDDSDFSLIENIIFPPEFSAIFHSELDELEAIYTILPEENKLINREFTFFYKGFEFKANFREPTPQFKMLAENFIVSDTSSDTDYRNLRDFSEFYNIENLPDFIQEYYADKRPINFFIEGDFASIDHSFVSLAKHLNFYMSYYHRDSPNLVIFEESVEEDNYIVPCYSVNEKFPQVLNLNKIDPVLLDLFLVARKTSNNRLRFIFYFQVLEYCAYYHLNDELKKRLIRIIKRPDLLNSSEKYSKLLIEEFKDNFKQNDDSIKLEKLLADFCTWEDIKMEIEANKDFFAEDLEFDGGFKITALINKGDKLDIEPKGIIKSVKSNIEKIRNVLVHLRESRENKVILPTPRNNKLILPYLFLIRRISEKIAVHHE
ncbi:hypothetical protein [Flavobacterium hibisci]|uniref:hypothetical protein n=1 Tax=Flavobacterium hibisci TaxID=1914462 RepID=UPI001CC08956|nr:hypothetical protein [Flavobacterium hibisci]MBZ4041191.1 hypothetical protein [Flavobacterium hibisci]